MIMDGDSHTYPIRTSSKVPQSQSPLPLIPTGAKREEGPRVPQSRFKLSRLSSRRPLIPPFHGSFTRDNPATSYQVFSQRRLSFAPHRILVSNQLSSTFIEGN